MFCVPEVVNEPVDARDTMASTVNPPAPWDSSTFRQVRAGDVAVGG